MVLTASANVGCCVSARASAALVASHCVDASRELGRSQDRYAAPRGHGREVGVLGYEQECADFGGEVEDEVSSRSAQSFTVRGGLVGSAWC